METKFDISPYLSRLIPKLTGYLQTLRVGKAYLTGSILEEEQFYDFSDVDVAVEGLQEEYFPVLSQLEEITGRSVDLIELEKCHFRGLIEGRGLRLR